MACTRRPPFTSLTATLRDASNLPDLQPGRDSRSANEAAVSWTTSPRSASKVSVCVDDTPQPIGPCVSAGDANETVKRRPEVVARFRLLLQQLADEHYRELAALRRETLAAVEKVKRPSSTVDSKESPSEHALSFGVEAAVEKVKRPSSTVDSKESPSEHALSFGVEASNGKLGRSPWTSMNDALKLSRKSMAQAASPTARVPKVAEVAPPANFERPSSVRAKTACLPPRRFLSATGEPPRKSSEGNYGFDKASASSSHVNLVIADESDKIDQVVAGHRIKRAETSALDPTKTSGGRSSGEKFVSGKLFGLCSAGLVVVNMLYLGVQADMLVRHEFRRLNGQASALARFGPFFIIDATFCFCFCVELCLRFVCLGVNDFVCGSDRWWHLFDGVVIITSFLDLLSEITGQSFGSGMSALRFVRLVRILRLLRLANSFSALRSSVRSMQTMLHALSGVVSSFCPAMVILCTCIYIFALMVLEAVRSELVAIDHESHVASPSDHVARLSEYYGSVLETLFTLLAAVTAGSDWLPAAAPLAAINPVFKAVFQLYIIFVLIGMLNVIAGLFVNVANTATSLERDIAIDEAIREEHKLVEQISLLLVDADSNESGTLSLDEITACAQDERIKAHFKSLDLDITSLCRIFELLDSDGTGEVEIRSFVKGCLNMRGIAKQVDIAMLCQMTLDMKSTMDSWT
eukprot:TRINITY_DN9318_c0_g1_i1.p1 TRINITY_DN9318_c0_g1~~TRINITY_DN9318_c0_g1_i1.p1  ORF type:complete len:693 (-),score=108.72 TRINITY_DN9318_c0_g1_i1:397-2475(-)